MTTDHPELRERITELGAEVRDVMEVKPSPTSFAQRAGARELNDAAHRRGHMNLGSAVILMLGMLVLGALFREWLWKRP